MITIYHIKKTILLIFITFISITVIGQNLPDNEIKKNVQTIDGSLQKLVKLNPSVFEYDTQKFKHLHLKQGLQYGFVAEEVQVVFPELVKQKNIPFMFGKNTYRDASIKTVDEASLIPLLVASVKELQLQVTAIKSEIEKLKTMNSSSAIR